MVSGQQQEQKIANFNILLLTCYSLQTLFSHENVVISYFYVYYRRRIKSPTSYVRMLYGCTLYMQHIPQQIPDSPRVSAECTDLLRGLLERDPLTRISFDRFFCHSFIDLDHMPSADSIARAVSILTAKNLADNIYLRKKGCEEN